MECKKISACGQLKTKTIKTDKTIAKSLPSVVRGRHNGLKGLVGLNALISLLRLVATTQRPSNYS